MNVQMWQSMYVENLLSSSGPKAFRNSQNAGAVMTSQSALPPNIELLCIPRILLLSDFVLKLRLPVKPAAEQLSIRLDLNCSGATRIAEALLPQILRLQSIFRIVWTHSIRKRWLR